MTAYADRPWIALAPVFSAARISPRIFRSGGWYRLDCMSCSWLARADTPVAAIDAGAWHNITVHFLLAPADWV